MGFRLRLWERNENCERSLTCRQIHSELRKQHDFGRTGGEMKLHCFLRESGEESVAKTKKCTTTTDFRWLSSFLPMERERYFEARDAELFPKIKSRVGRMLSSRDWGHSEVTTIVSEGNALARWPSLENISSLGSSPCKKQQISNIGTNSFVPGRGAQGYNDTKRRRTRIAYSTS